MFCTNCGSKLVDGAKFCSECGARVVRQDEPVFRTNPDIQFEEPKFGASVIEAPVYDETPERPVREKVSFDWSNVVDEPRRKDLSDIKSPWSTTGGIDEKAIYAEMTPSTEKSRTMSFIDILKAEKEEKEKAAADKAIEYTEVLQFDPDLTAFEEPPQLHYAPLYEDVDEHVTTPFDLPEEEEAEPAFVDEPQFEEPESEELPFEEPKFDEPRFEEPKFDEPEFEAPEVDESEPEFDEPEFDEPEFAEADAEEPEIEEPEEEAPEFEEPAPEEFEFGEPQRMAEAAEEPELEVSRETIAQFDEYVKSFEKEAGIVSEPEIEEPKYEEPFGGFPKFELPDFLKKVTEFASRKDEEPKFEEPEPEEAEAAEAEPVEAEAEAEAEIPAVEEPETAEIDITEPEYDDFEIYETEETEFEGSDFEDVFEPVVTPDIDDLFAHLTPAREAAAEPAFEEIYETAFVAEEPAAEEEAPVAEEPAEEPVAEEEFFEEPKYEEGEYSEYEESEDSEESMEDLYLDFESAVPSGRTMRFDVSEYDDLDDEEEEDEEAEEAVEEFFDAPEFAETSEEEAEEAEEPEEVIEEGIDEEALFREMEETSPEMAGMTIAPPADKQEEIEALRKRLAELTGIDPYDPADLTAAMSIDELEESEEIEEPAEEPAEEELKLNFDYDFEPEVTPDVDELFAGLTPASMAVEPEAEPEAEAEAEEEPAVEIEGIELEAPAIEQPEAVAEIEEIELEAPAVEEPEAEEEAAEEPAAEESMEDLYLDFEPAAPSGRTMRFDASVYEDLDAAEEEEPAEEPAPVIEVIEDVAEEAAPVEEIVEEPAPVIEVIEEAAEEAAPVEEIAEEPAPAIEAIEDIAEEFVPAEEVVEEPAPVIEIIEEAAEEAAPVEEVVEEPAPVVEVIEEIVEEPAPVVEEEPVDKETDALSLEELERDLFGDTLDEEVEAEETKKIDKFYTLYRKNEEFQRLLDEEYEKLKHGGGLTEEEKAAVDAVPRMADIEAAKAAAAEAIPVENKKAYRQVEDETIYMPKEELDAKLKAEAAAIAAAKSPVEVPDDKAAKKAAKEEKKTFQAETEYEEVESGSKFLTVLAVIIALILIVLLAVILILQIAPDSGIAAWIDSLIENITSGSALLEPFNGQFLL